MDEAQVTRTRSRGLARNEVLGKVGASILMATKGSPTVDWGDKSFNLEDGQIYFVAHGVRMDITASGKGLLTHTA